MQTPLPYLYGTVALFGLAFGSFLNVCIARLPLGESIITPRSHCPKCHHPIRWYDNIPVLSFLVLRGQCRDCRAPISLIYPAVEILTAALLVAAFARYQLSPEFVKCAVLEMLLIVLVFTDLIHRRIPHPVTILGTGLGFLLSLMTPVDPRPLDWILARLGAAGIGFVPLSFAAALDDSSRFAPRNSGGRAARAAKLSLSPSPLAVRDVLGNRGHLREPGWAGAPRGLPPLVGPGGLVCCIGSIPSNSHCIWVGPWSSSG
ncbi:MAG: prepilin peptidase [Acidobacteriia bacterium]|nr:prepilin peptidase [Terriglobia bacterium]